MRHVDTAAHLGPSVLIPRKGSLEKLYYVDVPFWTVDTIFYTEIGERIVPKFLYYHLSTQHLEELNQAGGIPSLTQSVLNQLRVPVPPLEIQQEIVRILDQFTQLESELEAELEARRRQYEHYRDSLIAGHGKDFQWLPMGEVGEFIRGRRFIKNDFTESGIPCIHYGEIYTSYGTSTTSTITHLPENMVSQLRLAKPKDVILAAVGETVEDVGKAVAWLGDTDVAIHDDCFLYRHPLNPKFVSYYLQTQAFHSQKGKFVSRAKVKRLSREGLSQITLAVPPKKEQERIVEILDVFGILLNDLSIGLPAELAARRKQYEYYRDQLLTFKERAV